MINANTMGGPCYQIVLGGCKGLPRGLIYGTEVVAHTITRLECIPLPEVKASEVPDN